MSESIGEALRRELRLCRNCGRAGAEWDVALWYGTDRFRVAGVCSVHCSKRFMARWCPGMYGEDSP